MPDFPLSGPYTVYGTVKVNGTAQSGATVTITNVTRGGSDTCTTDSSGNYVYDDLANLPNGYQAGDTIKVSAVNTDKTFTAASTPEQKQVDFLLVNNNISLKYDLFNILNKEVSLKYDIFYLLTDDLTLKYDIITANTLTKDLILKYDIFTLLSNDISLKYDLFVSVNNDISLKYDIFQPHTSDITLKYNILSANTLSKTLTLKYDVIALLDSDLTLKYDIHGLGVIKQLILQNKKVYDLTMHNSKIYTLEGANL